MKKSFIITAFFLLAAVQALAQSTIRVQAPNVVALDEQFNVTFVIESEKSPSDFSWSAGDGFQLVWGPQKGSSSSISIINGKRTSSHQTTYTYILMPKSAGTFQLPAASATVDGQQISSSVQSVQVVTNASSSQSSGQTQSSSGQASGQSSSSQDAASSSSGISSEDLFLRLSLSRSSVVVGEPITATLKLYQRVNIAGFENAKFPSFNGFWNQETYSPTNIEFERESFDDKIYNTAVLRKYVLIPQQTGTITIEPAELVCLVNVRVTPHVSNSIFDSFFQDDYRTIRKKVTTNPVRVNVSPLPAGQPASFGGGVGNFGISARVTSNELKTHDAASLIVTVSGRGNVALLEEPKVNFPPDFEVYDTKTTENTDKSSGSTSGSKTFEYPFIPRSHGEFTIPSVEYSYYDVTSGKYVTLRTDPVNIKVAKGKGVSSSSSEASSQTPGVERKDVRSLADDIRFISTKTPSFSRTGGAFFVGSAMFWVIVIFLAVAAVVTIFLLRKFAALKADVAGAKKRGATKMASRRLKLAKEYLDKNLYSPFYEELHKALVGYVSDKLSMDMSEINKDSIREALVARGAGEALASEFTDLLDRCEFARYSSESADGQMQKNFDDAVNVISSIDSNLKTVKKKNFKGSGLAVVLLAAGLGLSGQAKAQDSLSVVSSEPFAVADSTLSEQLIWVTPAELWQAGVQAYSESRFDEAADFWSEIVSQGQESAVLYYNLGNACFKLADYPRAVLNYERALKLDPSHADARYNLEYMSQFIQDKIEPVPEFILASLWRKACYLMSSNAWAWLFIVLMAAALALAVLFLVSSSTSRRRIGFYGALAAVVLSLLSLNFSIWQKRDYNKKDEAIIMAPVSSVKSSPSGDSSKDLFIVHEGTKVSIIDEVGTWKNISLADGRQGWILSDDLEVI